MIAIGSLVAIVAVYGGYLLIGLSLAFGGPDWSRTVAYLLGFGLALSLGLWTAIHNIRVLSSGQAGNAANKSARNTF